METLPDFEDMLSLLYKHHVRYLVIGGLAFIYHVKPRYTKDMDLWIDPSRENIDRANQALAEFGSPTLIEQGDPGQIIQIGVAPNRAVRSMANFTAAESAPTGGTMAIKPWSKRSSWAALTPETESCRYSGLITGVRPI